MTLTRPLLAALIVIALLLLPAADAAAQEQDQVPVFERPAYSPVLRQNEDWSALAGYDSSQTGDFFDPIKHIPLSEDGDIWVSFGGQARTRVEVWNNFGFVDSNSDEFLITRFLVHGDLHVGDNLRIFAEGKSAFSTRRMLPGGRRTLDADELDLHQGFVDLMLPFQLGEEDAKLTLRAGRQSLLFGNQRLVSPLPWANTMRAWDGFQAILEVHGWKVTGFWTQFVPVKKFDFNDADAQTEFYGVYATGHVPTLEQVNLDLYFLGLENDTTAMVNGTMGPDEERYTLGGRVWGKVADTSFDYELEGAWQGGEVGSGDVDAFFVAAEVGHRFGDWPAAPRVFVGFDYASGDDKAGGDVGTFDHLFPLGHKYLGYIDVIGRQNIIDLSTGVQFKPMKKLAVRVIGHFFWVADTADALYNAGGAMVRPGGIATSEEVGAELDVVLTYTFNTHLKGEFGYSQFWAGDFIDQTGKDSQINFTYFQLLYLF